jgi:hypothetical protein
MLWKRDACMVAKRLIGEDKWLNLPQRPRIRPINKCIRPVCLFCSDVVMMLAYVVELGVIVAS